MRRNGKKTLSIIAIYGSLHYLWGPNRRKLFILNANYPMNDKSQHLNYNAISVTEKMMHPAKLFQDYISSLVSHTFHPHHNSQMPYIGEFIGE